MKKNSPPTAKKCILIVDDHPLMRQGLVQLISQEPDLTVCGEAESAAQALESVRRVRPDLALVDISLPGKNGIELLKDLQALHPDLPVLVYSMHDELLYAERVLRAGGRGYISKHEGGRQLILAIRQVLEGQIYVSEKTSSRILELFSGRRLESPNSTVEQLTDRELEVLQLIGQGLSTRDIAQSLNLSSKTVEVHRVNIKRKLGVKTAVELIRFAVRWVESRSA